MFQKALFGSSTSRRILCMKKNEDEVTLFLLIISFHILSISFLLEIAISSVLILTSSISRSIDGNRSPSSVSLVPGASVPSMLFLLPVPLLLLSSSRLSSEGPSIRPSAPNSSLHTFGKRESRNFESRLKSRKFLDVCSSTYFYLN